MLPPFDMSPAVCGELECGWAWRACIVIRTGRRAYGRFAKGAARILSDERPMSRVVAWLACATAVAASDPWSRVEFPVTGDQACLQGRLSRGEPSRSQRTFPSLAWPAEMELRISASIRSGPGGPTA